MQFTLSPSQLDKLQTWLESQAAATYERQGCDNFIVAGGELTYTITPGIIMTVVKVKNNITGDVLDLTEPVKHKLR